MNDNIRSAFQILAVLTLIIVSGFNLVESFEHSLRLAELTAEMKVREKDAITGNSMKHVLDARSDIFFSEMAKLEVEIRELEQRLDKLEKRQ